LELLEHPPKYSALVMPYGTSKLALSLWSQALAPQLHADGIEIRSMNPGGTKTKMTMRSDFPRVLAVIRDLFFASPDVGAGRLYDVALGKWRGKTGIFINSDKVRKLPFSQLANAVLERVEQIYRHQYLALQAEEQSVLV
jgi:short-subunit dehydrogenase